MYNGFQDCQESVSTRDSFFFQQTTDISPSTATDGEKATLNGKEAPGWAWNLQAPSLLLLKEASFQ